jgi:hypothetical protein
MTNGYDAVKSGYVEYFAKEKSLQWVVNHYYCIRKKQPNIKLW